MVPPPLDDPPHLIGQTPRMVQIKQQLANAAPTDLSVLILGMPGTGKSHGAACLHALSPRRDKPLVTVDLSHVAPDRIEQELIGPPLGAAQQAANGTLVLDRLDSLSYEGQTRLLHVLNAHLLMPEGLALDWQAPVRLIGIANQPLMDLIKTERFRPDLFFRLQGVMVTLPPLRERKEDIPLLVEQFVQRHSVHPEWSARLNAAALSRLQAHDWPGQVTELETVVQRLIGQQDLPRIRAEDLDQAGLLGGS